MGFIELVKLILSLMPEVIGAVRAVEAALPQSGVGPQKLEAVLSAVQGVALSAPAIVSSGDETKTAFSVGDVPGIVSGLTHVVGAVVSLFNTTGIFQKSGVVQAINASGLPNAGRHN